MNSVALVYPPPSSHVIRNVSHLPPPSERAVLSALYCPHRESFCTPSERAVLSALCCRHKQRFAPPPSERAVLSALSRQDGHTDLRRLSSAHRGAGGHRAGEELARRGQLIGCHGTVVMVGGGGGGETVESSSEAAKAL